MRCATHQFSFDGALLARGFWLYVWEITTASGEVVYYVGRTGDSSSQNAQSPFNRIGQHLGSSINSNQLRTHLEHRGVDPEHCKFRLVAHGPVLEEATTRDEHRKRRDEVAALEKELACGMAEAGYTVLNTVACKKPVDPARARSVLSTFADCFTELAHRSADAHD